ncbi:MAG: hypothetical protein ACPLUL_02290 [Thermanaerothrix sp.]|uniref:hypothetical protein n=1 Tax=Thermanaerothrix sp. TaxID=2972675 RepID=UPI003C7D98C9
MDELTPEELDALIAFEAEIREQEERKFEVLYWLEMLPANDPLWAEIAQWLEQRRRGIRNPVAFGAADHDEIG